MCAVPVVQPLFSKYDSNGIRSLLKYYYTWLCVCLNHCTAVSSTSVMETDGRELISGVATFSKAVLPKMQFSVTLHGVFG